MTERTGKAAPSHRIRPIAVSFLIVVGGTVLGVALGMGGAYYVLGFAEGEEDARGGVMVFAGFVFFACAALGFVAGIIYAAWWLHKQFTAIKTAKPHLGD